MKRIVLSLTLVVLASALPAPFARAQIADPSEDATPDPNGTPDNNDGTPKKPEDMDPEDLVSDFDTITYWKAELPGGAYIIAHDSVNGVSSQEYVLDGAARVTEVNISTSGVMQPRFYYIEPLTPKLPTSAGQSTADRAKSALEDAASRVIPGDPVWARVIKEYPATTHAGTIEYRLETKDQIKRLYESLERSWIRGKSEVFRPEGVGRFDPNDEKKKRKDGEENSEGEPTDPNAEPSGASDPFGY